MLDSGSIGIVPSIYNENKGADELPGDLAADRCLSFQICKMQIFSNWC